MCSGYLPQDDAVVGVVRIALVTTTIAYQVEPIPDMYQGQVYRLTDYKRHH